jgi:hypothetical protein
MGSFMDELKHLRNITEVRESCSFHFFEIFFWRPNTGQINKTDRRGSAIMAEVALPSWIFFHLLFCSSPNFNQ